jgi:hypothetical protein
MLIDDDIDDIIKKGENKTAELNSKYAGLDLDALNNFKSESMVNQWEGEDFATARVSFFASGFGNIADVRIAEKPHLDRARQAGKEGQLFHRSVLPRQHESWRAQA